MITQRKHFPPLKRSVRFEVRNRVIPNGVFIDYVGNTVTIFDDKDTIVIEGIKEFQLYDIFLGFSTFYPSPEKTTFEGYGKCHIH